MNLTSFQSRLLASVLVTVLATLASAATFMITVVLPLASVEGLA